MAADSQPAADGIDGKHERARAEQPRSGDADRRPRGAVTLQWKVHHVVHAIGSLVAEGRGGDDHHGHKSGDEPPPCPSEASRSSPWRKASDRDAPSGYSRLMNIRLYQSDQRRLELRQASEPNLTACEFGVPAHAFRAVKS